MPKTAVDPFFATAVDPFYRRATDGRPLKKSLASVSRDG